MKPIEGLCWWIVGLVLSGLIMSHLTHNALAVVAPEINKVLNISTQQYGYIVAAFQVAYMVMQPVAGYVLDMLGTKPGFALFVGAWSVVYLLHSTADGWLSLAAFRAMLGMTEVAGFLSVLRATSEWLPAKERPIATGWFDIESPVGAVVAPPLVVWCVLHGNWRFAFAVTGGMGLVRSVLWFLSYRVPARHHRLSDKEWEYIRVGQETPNDYADTSKLLWGNTVNGRRFWGIAIPCFLSGPVQQTFNYWIPPYMTTEHHMNLKEIAPFAWLPFLATDVGCVLGGYLTPWFRKWFSVSSVASHKLVTVTGCLCMTGPACIGLATSFYTTIALFCVGGFAHQTLSDALHTLTLDMFDKHEVGTAVGLVGTPGHTGGMPFLLAVGTLATTIGYNLLFVALAVFGTVAAILVWTMLSDKQTHPVPMRPGGMAPSTAA